MLKTSPRLLPYEPGYTGHWEAERRRRETGEWLRRREIEVAARRLRKPAPSIVPNKANESPNKANESNESDE
jgi:hypothetical protein